MGNVPSLRTREYAEQFGPQRQHNRAPVCDVKDLDGMRTSRYFTRARYGNGGLKLVGVECRTHDDNL
jgi:hypothetical protein